MIKWAWVVVPALLLAGCSKKNEEKAPAAPTTLHEVMKNEVDTRADDVWAVGNAHISGDAGLDGASMTDARGEAGFIIFADCTGAVPFRANAADPPMPSTTARHPASGRMRKEPESLSPFMNHS